MIIIGMVTHVPGGPPRLPHLAPQRSKALRQELGFVGSTARLGQVQGARIPGAHTLGASYPHRRARRGRMENGTAMDETTIAPWLVMLVHRECEGRKAIEQIFDKDVV